MGPDARSAAARALTAPAPGGAAESWWVSLGRLPRALYPALAEHPGVRADWAAAFCADDLEGWHPPGSPLDPGFLERNPGLGLDSARLEGDLRAAVERAAGGADPDGLLVRGDNLAAMCWLAAGGAGAFRCVYADPPYNTGKTHFPYPDRFARDEWLEMMRPRLAALLPLMDPLGVALFSIGREMMAHLHLLLDDAFGEDSALGELVWERGRKNDARFFSLGHEYVLVRARDRAALAGSGAIFREPKPGARSILAELERLRALHGRDHQAVERGLASFYAGLPEGHPALKHKRYRRVDDNGLWRDDNMSWPGGGGPRYEVRHPVTGAPCAIPPGGWRFATPESFQRYVDHGFIEFRADHRKPPMLKRYLNPVSTDFDPRARRRSGRADQNVQVMPSVFYRGALPAVRQLRDLMGRDAFPNPKDPEILGRLISYVAPADALTLDPFGGSGATAQAVIDLNREDGGRRRFALIERGAHFEDVTAPRVLRARYAAGWDAGRPDHPGPAGEGWSIRTVRL